MISEFRKSPLFAALVLATVGSTACGKESSGPAAPVPSSVALSTSPVQSAVVGSVVSPGLTFSVKDQNGNSLAGIPVTVTVTAGGGTLTGAPTTTASGETSIGVFTLGTIVGVNTVTIKAGSLAPITFSITTVAGAPAQITASGAGQSAPAGTALPGILVKVADQFGNGVAGQSVTVSVAEGGGFVTPATGTTNASGQLTFNWTLGKSAVPQKLSVTSGTINQAVQATVATSFGLEVRYYGGDPSPGVRASFDNAVARLRGAITGTFGIPVRFTNINLNAGNTNCQVPVTLNEDVTDVLIFAKIAPIDGPGKILGRAGPCLPRSDNRLTVIGTMEFDSDDLNNLLQSGRLEPVILHEMSHVVGFGTLWNFVIPSRATGLGGGDPRFTGVNATNACVAAGGTSLCTNGVAIENCVGLADCGAGNRDGHWREGCTPGGTNTCTTVLPGFRTELMTPFIGSAATQFSEMTVQSFGDIGYGINLAASDPYSVPSPTLRALLGMDTQVDETQWETVRRPVASISPNGVIRALDK